MPDSDRELIGRAVAGDRAAFGELLGRHYDRLHRVAWRLTGSMHDVEDIAQEVCCALVERLAGFRGEAKFATWLTGRIAGQAFEAALALGRHRTGTLAALGCDARDPAVRGHVARPSPTSTGHRRHRAQAMRRAFEAAAASHSDAGS